MLTGSRGLIRLMFNHPEYNTCRALACSAVSSRPAQRLSRSEGRFTTRVTKAHKYLSEGGSLDSLSVLKASDLDLIPRDSLISPSVIPTSDARYAYGLWLGERPDGRIGIGEFVWYLAVIPLIERLRDIAGEIYFTDPIRLSTSAPAPYTQGWLMMVFTREQLARAAELLNTPIKKARPMLADHLETEVTLCGKN